MKKSPSSIEEKVQIGENNQNQIEKSEDESIWLYENEQIWLTELNAEKQASKTADNKIVEDLKAQLEDKPSFRTTRKAIQIAAEEMASQEFLDAPQQEHLDSVISNYKLIYSMNPKILYKIVNLTAKSKEIKDEVGPDLHKIFTQVWEKELTANMKNELDDVMATIHQTKTLTEKGDKDEIVILVKRYIEKKIQELKKDPRILSAFAGKEELLDKLLNFVVSAMGAVESIAEDFDN